MEHIFKKGKNNKTLIMFHGKNENMGHMMLLSREIDIYANVICFSAPHITTYGSSFFELLKDGSIDLEKVDKTTKEMIAQIHELLHEYALQDTELVAVGNNFGTGFVLNTLLNEEDIFAGAILMHPLFENFPITKHTSNTKVLITAGINDEFAPKTQTQDLEAVLVATMKKVSLEFFSYHAEISQDEVDAIVKWYAINFK